MVYRVIMSEYIKQLFWLLCLCSYTGYSGSRRDWGAEKHAWTSPWISSAFSRLVLRDSWVFVPATQPFLIRSSRFTHSVAFHNNLDKHCVIFDVFSFLDVFVRSKFSRAEARIFVGPGPAKKRLVFRTHIWFNWKHNVFPFRKVFVLIQ